MSSVFLAVNSRRLDKFPVSFIHLFLFQSASKAAAMSLGTVKGKGALGTTAALILALVVFSAGASNVAAQMTAWIGLIIAALVVIFAVKVLASRGLGGLSFR